MEPVRVLFSAISGYGYYYLKSMIEDADPGKALVAGVVDPMPEKSGHYEWILQNKVPVFNSVEEFYDAGKMAELAVISSPPQYHVDQAIHALEHGSNVLVDKPAGVGAPNIEKLVKTAAKAGRWVEVGYQWSFSRAIQELKSDIVSGLYGLPLRAGSICLWPRDYSYYSRNNWAGRITDPVGRLVYDSPANNACAHFLHNLLYLLEDYRDSVDYPFNVECLKFKAFDIENFDTICLKAGYPSQLEIFFYASHSTELSHGPEFRIEFTGGEVRYEGDKPAITGTFGEGKIKNYGSPEDDYQFKKLFQCIKAVRKTYTPVCPPEKTIAHSFIIDEIQKPEHETIMFRDELVVKDANRRWVRGLNKSFKEAYKRFDMINYEL